MTDFYEIAEIAEDNIGVDMYLDIVFSDELKSYFNYRYNSEEDIFTLTFETEDGSAILEIIDAKSDFSYYKFNNVLDKYIKDQRSITC